MAAETAMQQAKAPKYAWVILTVTVLASLAVPLNMFKPPTIAIQIIMDLNMAFTTFGWTMSVFNLMGVILAFPAAGIAAKMGVKPTILVSVAFVAVGAIIGAMAHTATVLLVSRFIEGAGMGLMAVSAPTAIAMWFPPAQRGLALGIWNPWVPFSSCIMSLVAPRVAAVGTWHAVWWVGAVYAIVVFVLFAIFFRYPDAAPGSEGAEAAPEEEGIKFGNPFKQGSIWLICLIFLLFSITILGTITTYYPTFLQQAKGFTEIGASWVAFAFMAIGVPSAPIAGALSDKIGRKKVLFIGLVATLLGCCTLFAWKGTAMMWVLVIVIGFFASFLTSMMWAYVPEIVGPKSTGIGMAICSFGNNVGQMIGGVALGYVLGFGWTVGSWIVMVPCGVIALILGFFVKTAAERAKA